MVAFVGDSYTGASPGFVSIAAATLGWDARNFGRGGTSFGRGVSGPMSKTACGLDYCQSYAEMVAEVAKVRPDIVVVSGGANQVSDPSSSVAADIASFYVLLRHSLPSARIIGTSPLWNDKAPPDNLRAMQASVKAAVEAVAGEYVDLGEPLRDRPDLVGPDGVHPNLAGHEAIAAAFASAIRR